jgi:hypothetical protein
MEHFVMDPIILFIVLIFSDISGYMVLEIVEIPRQILTQIRTVCYIADHILIQPRLHSVTNPVKLCTEPFTFLQIRSHFITDPSHFDTYPTTFRYVSNHGFTHIRKEFLTHPITFCYRSEHNLQAAYKHGPLEQVERVFRYHLRAFMYDRVVPCFGVLYSAC